MRSKGESRFYSVDRNRREKEAGREVGGRRGAREDRRV
jgi:hypothetical protein